MAEIITPPHTHISLKTFLQIALPASAIILTEPLYSIVDVAILSKLGDDPVAGAALATQVMYVLAGLCVVFLFSTTSETARAAAIADTKKVGEIRATTLRVGLLFSGLLFLIGMLVVVFFSTIFKQNPDVISHGRTYLFYSLFGIPAVAIIFCEIGFLRGIQNNIRPLIAAVTGTILNIATEYVAINILNHGVAASALCSVFARWVVAIYITISPEKKQYIGKASMNMAKKILSIDLYLWFRTGLVLTTFFSFSFVASKATVQIVNAQFVLTSIWGFSIFAFEGLEVIGQSLVAQAQVSNKIWRLFIQKLFIFTVSSVSIVCIAIWVLRPTIVPLLAPSTDSQDLASGNAYQWMILALAVGGFATVTDGILIGLGSYRELARNMAIASVVAGALLTCSYVFFVSDHTSLAFLWPIWSITTLFLFARGSLGIWTILRSKAIPVKNT